MRKKVYKRSLALLLGAAIVAVGIPAAAENSVSGAKADTALSVSEISEYAAYIGAQTDSVKAKTDITVSLDAFKAEEGASAELKNDYNGAKALLWKTARELYLPNLMSLKADFIILSLHTICLKRVLRLKSA